MLSKDIDECVTLLLQELVRFQERIYQKDPIKAKMKRRLVMGLREVTKHMKLKKIKCVIISPNCEKIQSKGTVDIINTSLIWSLTAAQCHIISPSRRNSPWSTRFPQFLYFSILKSPAPEKLTTYLFVAMLTFSSILILFQYFPTWYCRNLMLM